MSVCMRIVRYISTSYAGYSQVLVLVPALVWVCGLVWGGEMTFFEPLTEVDRSCQTASVPVQNESQNLYFDEVLYACTSRE